MLGMYLPSGINIDYSFVEIDWTKEGKYGLNFVICKKKQLLDINQSININNIIHYMNKIGTDKQGKCE